MAAVSCCGRGGGALPLPSSSTNLFPQCSQIPSCSSGVCAAVSAYKSNDSRDLSLCSADSGASRNHGVRWSRPSVSAGDFSASASARGGISRQDSASSSSCCYGSAGSSFLHGDCGHGNARASSWDVGFLGASSGRKCRRRCRNGHECRAIRSRASEETGIVREITDLSQNLLTLKGVVTTEYRAIGPEMRGRVERLYERAVVLRDSVDRAISSGSRIPTQLTANLIALQREHGSLENIVRLAMEASPALESLETVVSRSNALSNEASNLLSEETKPKGSIFQSLVRESALKPVKSAPPKYTMSAPASKGSSPLAAFRAEIERRVIEQLSGKKVKKPATPPNPALPVSDSSLPLSQNRPSDGALADRQTSVETLVVVEEKNGQLLALSSEESVGTVTMLEDKLKQLELDLAKSIPLQVFEQKVGKINTALSDARAEVVQLTAEVAEKEAILAAVKKDMLAEHEQLMEKVRELTGDLEKSYTAEDIEAAVNFGLEALEKELEEEQDRTFLLTVELEKKEKFIVEQQENWRIMKEEMEKKLEEEQSRALSLSLELDSKVQVMTEQEKKLEEEQNRALSLSLELESKVNIMTEQEKKLEEERNRALSLSLELESKVKEMTEQERKLEEEQNRALNLSLELETQAKVMTEQETKFQEEQNRALSLSLELDTKEKVMIEQEEAWKGKKMTLENDLKSVQVKLQDVRKKRTKERSQLAEKKQKVKFLEQELVRLQETMEEADRLRLKNKEATSAAVRGLITQMVQSSRARADSDGNADNVAEDVANLHEVSELSGSAEFEIEEIKASLANVGKDAANLQGELPLDEKAAALEKFFGMMGALIKQESDHMEDDSPSLEADYASDNELLEDEELQTTADEPLPATADAGGEAMGDQAAPRKKTSRK